MEEGDEDTTGWLDCPRCEEPVMAPAPGEDGEDGFSEGDSKECPHCHATVTVFIDTDEGPFLEWACEHGIDGEEPCAECDAKEDEEDAKPEPEG